MAQLICNWIWHQTKFKNQGTKKHIHPFSFSRHTLWRLITLETLFPLDLQSGSRSSSKQGSLSLSQNVWQEIRYTVRIGTAEEAVCLCLFIWRSGRMTHQSTVYALVVEERFLQGDFLRSDLLPRHILSAVGQEVSQSISEVTWVHSVAQHCFFKHTYYSTIINSSPAACFKIDAVYLTEYVYVLFIHACECVTWSWSYLDVLRSVHLLPLLLQLLQYHLQGAFHRRLRHFLLRGFLFQLRAEAFGQRVAALTGQRWQVLFRLHQLLFWWERWEKGKIYIYMCV